VDTLCKKSFLLFTTFSCNFANFSLVLFPLFLEYFLCVYFNLFCDFLRYFGLLNISPLEVMAKSLIPKSIPIVVSSLILGLTMLASPVSQRIDTKYLSVGVLLIVACLISPLSGLCRIISIPFFFVNLGITNLLSTILTFCGILKLPLFVFFF